MYAQTVWTGFAMYLLFQVWFQRSKFEKTGSSQALMSAITSAIHCDAHWTLQWFYRSAVSRLGASWIIGVESGSLRISMGVVVDTARHW